MKIRIRSIVILPILMVVIGTAANASVDYDFTNKGEIFDNETLVIVPLIDSANGFSISMTVTSTGGELNSNSGDFGVNGTSGTSDFIDGTGEAISLTFDKDISFNFIDLGGVGSDISDGAELTIAGETIVLFTDVSGFNGTTNIYTPSSPVLLQSGNSITLTGSATTSDFDLEAINFSVVPEPGIYALLLGLCGMTYVTVLRRDRQ